ncbi:MAG: hypothetical protein V3R80_00530, partial [Candidatus Tectomicrobia bacterium]
RRLTPPRLALFTPVVSRLVGWAGGVQALVVQVVSHSHTDAVIADIQSYTCAWATLKLLFAVVRSHG